MSEAADEAVEAGYNAFLSLYDRLGVCPVHLDSPEAKWTLDLYIDQSVCWPIQVSQKIWSTNPLERLNKENKRRTNVVAIFPNETSLPASSPP